MTWEDFNEDTKELTVNKQLTNKIGTGKSEFISPKTKNSYRHVKLDNITYNMLMDLKRESFVNSKEFIFFGNKPISPTQIERIKNRHYEMIADQQDYIVVHGFRHSCCSLCIQSYLDNNKSINFLAIANRLGDTVDTVLSVYAHLYPSASEELSDII